MQYNLRNDNSLYLRSRGEPGLPVPAINDRFSSYGINNHFLYKINDRWKAGMRFEWLRDNGGGLYVTEYKGDYYQMTLGLNWNPRSNVSIRPEIRYDWVRGAATPFADGTKRNQLSGGCGIVLSF